MEKSRIVEKNTYCYNCKKPTDTIKVDNLFKCDDCGINKRLERTIKQVRQELYGFFILATFVLLAVIGFIVTIYWIVSLFL